MRKRIIIALSVFSLIFLAGGVYITSAIETSINKLKTIITLHQVEILKEQFLHTIRRTQFDLSLKDTRYVRSIDTIVRNVLDVEDSFEGCFSCHHPPYVLDKLTILRKDVDNYKDSISNLLTLSANVIRLDTAEDLAFMNGEKLVTEMNTIISESRRHLEIKTSSSLEEITDTSMILHFLVAVVPFFVAGLGYVFIRGFTEPVKKLLKTTRILKEGDLDSRVEGLKYEFGEVADSVNEMAASLKEYIQKMEESEKRYRMLFENASDAIFVLEAEGENRGRILAANRAAAEMHGYSVDELLSLSRINALVGCDVSGKELERVQDVLEGRKNEIEIAHCRKDGTIFPIEISAGSFEFMNHRYIFLFGRDIEERKKAEETLQRAKQMKIAGEWATGLAHEIKNPLAGIKVSVEVLAEEDTISPEGRTIILKVVEEIKRIESLLKNLLNFARPTKPHIMGIDINDLLDKAIDFSLKHPTFSSDVSPSIKIIRDFDSDIPEVLVDPMQMRQVFLNILFNAIESMYEGGTLTVTTVYDGVAQLVRVYVSDTGKGLSDEVKDRIFEPFFTTKIKGTGFGLAITKQLLEQHGGSISLENRPGGGATCCVSLPVRKESSAA